MQCGESSASVAEKKDVNYDRAEDKPNAEAIILYPSFGAPLVAKPGKPVRLIVLFERKLHELYQSELRRNPDKKTPKTIEVINAALKVHSWSNGKKNPKKLLFPSNATAMANIHCHYIKNMNLALQMLPGRRQNYRRMVLDKYKNLIGLLRPRVSHSYLNHTLGFRYLFELEIHNLALPEGLHDCAWELNDPKSPCKSMDPPLPMTERQDVLARDYIKNAANHVKSLTGYKIEQNGELDFEPDSGLPLCNRHPIYITAKPKLNLGQLTDIHVSSRQMSMKYCEAQVLPTTDNEKSPKICSLVNVSFDTFKNLLDQMGNDKTVDLLVLTGDLIDFNQNFDPKTALGNNWKTQLKQPATMWNWMDPKRYGGKEHDPRAYPVYIDMLTIYSLLNYYMKTYNKPIVMLTGNHEAYEKPYGISPRLGQFWGKNPEGVMKANDGIPADHNLTIYEAALLYGPTYYQYQETWNFASTYLEWFYTMFNPLSDFVVTFGAGAGAEEQSFTALEWEDEEQFIENKVRGGGTLPRATRAISDAQLKLLQESSKRGKDRVLLTHFTFVSYGYDIQITAQGEVNYNNDSYQSNIASVTNFVPYVGHLPSAAVRTASDWAHIGPRMSHYDEGTFIENRKEVYNMLYDGDFTHVFSGHTHRAGFYVMTDKVGTMSSNVKVKGHLIEEEAKMLHPTKLLQGGKARFIVGASGGPIPGQNHYGKATEKGLGNWSLDYPSGNVLKLNGADTLHLKRSTKPTAQPRFAVALSYFDTLNERVFQKFESGRKGAPDSEFEVKIHGDLPGERFIAQTTLYSFYGQQWVPQSLQVIEHRPVNLVEYSQHLKMKVADFTSARFRLLLLKKKDSKSTPRLFLSITFTTALSGKIGYTQYNYNSPWIFPIRLIDKKKEAQKYATVSAVSSSYPGVTGYEEQMMQQRMVDETFGYRVEAHGEVPDFAWYQETFNGYSNGQDLPQAADKSIK